MECGFGRGGVRRDAGIAGDDFMLKEAVDKKSLENIRILYEGSFPESEKKPFSFMLQKTMGEGQLQSLPRSGRSDC